jgi:hypothetical protein
VQSIECTEEGRGWHPHSHAVWLCEEAPSQVLLSEEWHDITGDSFIVDVRPIVGDLVFGLLETFKYSVKAHSLTVDRTLEAAVTLRGKRLVSSFGLLYDVEVPDDLTDELLDDLPFVELLYRFFPGIGYQFQGMGQRAA